MASRDITAVLNGMRKIATAYYAELGSELQNSAKNFSLQPLVGALYESCSCTDNQKRDGSPFPEWNSFEDDFAEFGSFSDHFPSFEEPLSSAADGSSFLHTDDSPVPAPPSQSSGQNGTGMGRDSGGFFPGPANRRSFHAAAALHLHSRKNYFHTSTFPQRKRFLHTGIGFANDTVIGPTTQTTNKHTTEHSKSKQKLNPRARERAVPASRIGRMASFGGLAAGLGIGTAVEIAKRALGVSDEHSTLGKSPLLTEANIERIVNTLCRVRGAALKLGQMISLQDGSVIPDPVQQVFERVRNNADFMPAWQMERVLREELGEAWMSKLKDFDPLPLAAASIGQVHKATMHDGREVAMKIQYPGVAQSINSDIDNLVGILKLWNIIPEGLFLDTVVAVVRKELAWETDYIREAKCGMRFKEMLADDPRFAVPAIIPELSTKRVLTAELIHGMPLDRCISLSQETRNDISERILGLCLRELFEFRFMQTDPNWSNFFYNDEDNKVYLLDFGATRDYPKRFADDYIKVIHGAVTNNREEIVEGSKDLGFLTGYESKVLVDAHIDAVKILGEPFATDGPFDFSSQNTTMRIHRLIPILLEHRLTPPPEASYSLHRKWAGSFLLCTKLGAKINCNPMFQKSYEKFRN